MMLFNDLHNVKMVSAVLLLDEEDATPIPNGFLPLVHTNSYIKKLHRLQKLLREMHSEPGYYSSVKFWMSCIWDNKQGE